MNLKKKQYQQQNLLIRRKNLQSEVMPFEILQRTKKNEFKKMKNAYVNYDTVKQTIYTLLKSQREKKTRKGQKNKKSFKK